MTLTVLAAAFAAHLARSEALTVSSGSGGWEIPREYPRTAEGLSHGKARGRAQRSALPYVSGMPDADSYRPREDARDDGVCLV